jgi:hypothetical protein
MNTTANNNLKGFFVPYSSSKVVPLVALHIPG